MFIGDRRLGLIVFLFVVILRSGRGGVSGCRRLILGLLQLFLLGLFFLRLANDPVEVGLSPPGEDVRDALLHLRVQEVVQGVLEKEILEEEQREENIVQ